MDSYWQFLLEGKTAYEPIASDRFNAAAWKGRGPGKVITDTACQLKGADRFDALAFNVSDKDARALPVAARKLVEVSFVALRDAGIDYRNGPVGVYAAGVVFDILSNSGHDEFEPGGTPAGYPNAIANRISYALNLHGPSVAIDNACSSTLTAMHLALSAIRAGDCEAAVVAGCQFNSRLEEYLQLSAAQVLSADGRCKPFDALADGFGRSDGAAAVVVKRLSAALRDGDHVYGTLLATALTTNGSEAPANAPCPAFQKEAIVKAYARAQRSPHECDYAELHATGTAVGDPAEANAAGEILGGTQARSEPLMIGSVKGNVGHLENTAFLASLLKSIYMLQTRTVPPQASLTQVNPRIRWQQHNLQLAREKTRLPCKGKEPLISLSSFGIGGTNGHAILEGFSSNQSDADRHRINTNDDVIELDAPILLSIGALSAKQAGKVAEVTYAQLERAAKNGAATRSQIASLATRLAREARQCTWRSHLVTTVRKMLSSDAQPLPPMPNATMQPKTRTPLLFVLSGQGPQHARMGKEMFDRFPVFRNAIRDMDAMHQAATEERVSLVEQYGLFDPRRECSKQLEASPEWPATVLFPALAMLQMALFDTLVDVLGQAPHALIAHSAGEAAMTYASGRCSKEFALRLAILRGKHMQKTQDNTQHQHAGGMAALACDEVTALQLIKATRADGVAVAAYNAKDAVALSGRADQLSEVLREASKRDIWARRLRTTVPSHSPMMDICKQDFLRDAEALLAQYPQQQQQGPRPRVLSSVTGHELEQPYDLDYLWNNIRQPVRFHEALSALRVEYISIELGPHPVLGSYLDTGKAYPTLQRPASGTGASNEVASLLDTVGGLGEDGYSGIRVEALNWDTPARIAREVFPPAPYPFERQQFPLYADHRE